MSQNNAYDVVIVGSAHMDLLVHPVNSNLFDTVSYPAKEMKWSVGGDAINEASVITKLGHRVKLISCFGADSIGDMIIDHCNKYGIGTDYLKRDPEKTTGINIGLIADDGERVFINNRSGSIWTFVPEDVDLDQVDGAKILSFASIFNNPNLDERLLIPLFEKAKAQGMLICADIVGAKRGETIEDVKRALSYLDFFFPNYDEASRLTGKKDYDEIADTLLGIGVKNVIMKVGKDGCLVKNKDLRMIVPRYPKAKCVDTTGAGDNFVSGFVTAMLEGKDLKECTQYAHCASSLAIEVIGTTNGVKDRAQLEERYQEYLKCFR